MAVMRGHSNVQEAFQEAYCIETLSNPMRENPVIMKNSR